ncbi:MAG: serine/threonine-protein kinase, partial [Planctomycetota bacterium]|nr:serine/threonine-protein kinase [Planctomycetota bacterium]
MERDQWQAQKLIELAYVSEDEIRRAYADPRRGPQMDLCALLQGSALLSPEQVQWVRQSSPQNPAQMTHVHGTNPNPPSNLGFSGGYIQSVPDAPGGSSSHSQTLIQSQSGTINPGDKIGPYAIVRKIGQGGMGMVFEARHETLDQRVALKTLISGSELNEEQLERFEIEAQAMARLRHPNIVRVLDVAIISPMTYMAMEFVDGGDLQQLIREKKTLDEKLTAEIGEKLAKALSHAHRQSIIHRDMKPANVLLDQKLEPYITDFGLAKQVEDSSRALTKTGDFLGTPVYMPPEQIENRGFPDGRMDIYSLGVTLYEMLTGTLPFEGATAINIVNQVLSKEPLPPGELRANLDRDLETIVLKCMEKEKELRYDNAQELANDLRAFLNNEEISARRLTAFERFQKWKRRNRGLTRGLFGITTVAIVLLLVGAFFSFQTIMSERDGKQEKAREAEAARSEAEKDRTLAAEKAAMAESEVFLEKGYALLSRNRYREAAFEFIKVTKKLKDRRELRQRTTWEVKEVKLLESAELGYREALVRNGFVNKLSGGDTNQGVLDRDGRIFVSFQRDENGIFLIRAIDCRSEEVLWKSEPISGIVSTIRIAPDGKRFVASVNNTAKKFSQLQMRNIETGTIIWTRNFEVEGQFKNAIGPLDFSHDSAGQYLCTGGWPNTYVIETKTGKILRTFKSQNRRNAPYPNPTYSVSFSDDDRLVASAYPDGTMTFWELASGRDVWFGNFGRVRYAQFLSRIDPEMPYRFVLSSHSGRVSIYQLNKQSQAVEVRLLAAGQYGDCTFLYQSSSKRLFAAGFTDGSLVIWNSIGTKLRRLVHPGIVSCTISQDDQFVVSVGEEEPRRWRIDRSNSFFGDEGP